ncbi:hypothetical protein RUND412_009905 [Rhizina undulata]
MYEKGEVRLHPPRESSLTGNCELTTENWGLRDVVGVMVVVTVQVFVSRGINASDIRRRAGKLALEAIALEGEGGSVRTPNPQKARAEDAVEAADDEGCVTDPTTITPATRSTTARKTRKRRPKEIK